MGNIAGDVTVTWILRLQFTFTVDYYAWGIIFLNLKLLPSVLFEALWLLATNTNVNSTFGPQWVETQQCLNQMASVICWSPHTWGNF